MRLHGQQLEALRQMWVWQLHSSTSAHPTANPPNPNTLRYPCAAGAAGGHPHW